MTLFFSKNQLNIGGDIINKLPLQFGKLCIGCAPDVVQYIEKYGYPLIMNGIKTAGSLINYRIYGNTSQASDPTPTAPVEVQSVGIKTKNLFDKNNIVENYYYNPSGEYVAISSTYISDFIPVSAVSYTLSSNGASNRRINFFDSSKQWISQSLTTAETYSFTPTDTACYVRISFNTNVNKEVIQLEKGTTATAYEPYGYKIPVTITQDNAFDCMTAEQIYTNGILILERGENSLKVTTITSASNHTSLKIGNTADLIGKTINISTSTAQTSGWFFQLVSRKADGTWVNGYTTQQLTVVDDGSDMICLLVGYVSQIGSITYEDVKVSISESNNIYLDKPLNKLNNNADYIDFLEQKVVRTVGVKALDGTEQWVASSAYVGSAYVSQLLSDAISQKGGFCTHFIDAKYLSSYAKNKFLIEGKGTTNLWLSDTKDVAVENIKTFLTEQKSNGTPVTIYYPLMTSVIENITIPTLPVYEGTTIYTVDGLAPSDMYGKAKK